MFMTCLDETQLLFRDVYMEPLYVLDLDHISIDNNINLQYNSLGYFYKDFYKLNFSTSK